MNYLVIGDSGSMHIYNFVKTVLLPRKYKVHLLTLSTKPIRHEYWEFYRQNEVTEMKFSQNVYRMSCKNTK